MAVSCCHLHHEDSPTGQKQCCLVVSDTVVEDGNDIVYGDSFTHSLHPSMGSKLYLLFPSVLRHAVVSFQTIYAQALCSDQQMDRKIKENLSTLL